MIAHLTWQPDDTNQPEILTVDMPATHITEMQQLLADGTPLGGAVLWIPVRDTAGTYTPRLFRLARITAIEETTR